MSAKGYRSFALTESLEVLPKRPMPALGINPKDRGRLYLSPLFITGWHPLNYTTHFSRDTQIDPRVAVNIIETPSNRRICSSRISYPRGTSLAHKFNTEIAEIDTRFLWHRFTAFPQFCRIRCRRQFLQARINFLAVELHRFNRIFVGQKSSVTHDQHMTETARVFP